MGQRLQNKVCLLLGAGSSSAAGGLSNGQAVALTFAREGASLVLVDQHLAAAKQTADMIAEQCGTAIALQGDVSDHGDVRRVVAATVERFGRIDILHNNVGIEGQGGVMELSEAMWDRVHDVNLKSVFLSCKEVLPLMIAQGAGVVINVSSTASLRWGPAEYIAYHSTKSALNHITRIMARQYAGQGIRCNVVAPGMIDSPHIRTLYQDQSQEELQAALAARNARCPMGRQGTSQEVANAALFLASDEASYVSGVVLPVDGALSV